ncbi:MAG: hypothetical protein EKK64_08225 [Neisseriaceae bacterium]|nr:MAG: hypothetical protein EKK64_08225 [Neisseriaceae bacterium]
MSEILEIKHRQHTLEISSVDKDQEVEISINRDDDKCLANMFIHQDQIADLIKHLKQLIK